MENCGLNFRKFQATNFSGVFGKDEHRAKYTEFQNLFPVISVPFDFPPEIFVLIFWIIFQEISC